MKNSKLKNLFTILFLGGLWGALEATLGALLHMEVFDSILFTSTAVLLPIAYLIMGRAYEKTGTARSAFYVGLVAASIKAVCFFYVPMVNKVVNPMVAIVLESLVTAAAFAVTKPEKVLSLKSFVTFVGVSFVARGIYIGYSMATAVPFGSSYIKDGVVNMYGKKGVVEYLFTYNAISFVYMAAYMGIGKLLNTEKTAKFMAKIEKFAYSPIAATLMVIAAIGTMFIK